MAEHTDDDHYGDADRVECWQCGGIGLTADCFEDCCSGADCDPDDAENCCNPHRCDVCEGKGGWAQAEGRTATPAEN